MIDVVRIIITIDGGGVIDVDIKKGWEKLSRRKVEQICSRIVKTRKLMQVAALKDYRKKEETKNARGPEKRREERRSSASAA